MKRARQLLGSAAIALALGFNIPYAVLASLYDYPAILRRPAAEALDRFAALGSSVILAWHGFALAALALVPLAIALAITPARLRTSPAVAIGAAMSGALAGLAQAIGLWRWVFVVPALARSHADPATPFAMRQADETAFALLNAYGGVAIGEHIGQLLTALFVGLVATLQWREDARRTAWLGFATALIMALGAHEGLALALGADGSLFSAFTIAAFAGLTAWLIATGAGLIKGRTAP
ncbi:MAG: DUF4386 family protein [Novosphingobium sp.]|uniref:DUF4386 family protein n=1 Tax=Novosphingobium sp. TaxID=1874826 RepID=UPI00301B5A89